MDLQNTSTSTSKVNALVNSLNSFLDNAIAWVAQHPKVSLTIGIFVLGFILGLLF